MKTILLSTLLLLLSFSAIAQDNSRITKLEQEIQSINQRLMKLESAQGASTDAPKALVNSEGWKSLASWRSLATGMTTSDVRRILGEPARVDGGEFAIWYYQNRGDVTFIGGKVNGWREPR
jgi:outer membrane protein assembly factor BamE (lipoprotein component of BamABCDE complex)